jgi:hypothetical protein
MTERREESLFYQALGYISQVESGFGLYDCLHNGVGMTNAEIEEAGYELEEYYQKDTPEHLAAASNQRYLSLEELERQARKAVEFIIQDGTENTLSGNWILSFVELEQQSGLCVEGKPFFQQLIGNMLCERPEVADLSIDENGFDVTYYLDFCRNFEQETEPEAVQTDGSRQKLCELLRIPLADVHLVHKEVNINPATIVELSENTLTDAGKQAWTDVLDAEVCRIYAGAYGLQVELAGVKPYRLQDFSTMLAGYCSEENYEKWVAAPKEAPAQSPEMKL